LASNINPNNLNSNVQVSGSGSGIKVEPTISDADFQRRKALVKALGETEASIAKISPRYQNLSSSDVTKDIKTWSLRQLDDQKAFEDSISAANDKASSIVYTDPNGTQTTFSSWKAFNSWYSDHESELTSRANTYAQLNSSISALEADIQHDTGVQEYEPVRDE